jgi:tetratricopeptide (TPR) repeat protein
MRGMFLNFSLAATQLGQLRARQNNYGEAVERLELALKLNPELKWPRLMLGTVYHQNGERQKAIDHYRDAAKRDPGEGEYWLRLAQVFEVERLYDAALGVINEGMQSLPDYRNFYIAGFRISARMGRADLAKQYVRRWLDRKPDDQQFQGLYGNIDRVLADEFGLVPPGGDSLGTETGE